MGYPMTYRRVLNRNHLATGSYEAVPQWWPSGMGPVAWDLVGDDDRERLLGVLHTFHSTHKSYQDAIDHKLRLLAGDLRRLESDTTDENAVCKDIARRTGVGADVVAAVLLAWMQV